MAPERRKLLILAVVVVALAAVVITVYQDGPGPTAPAGTAVPGARASNGRGQSRPQTITAPDVHLDALSAERPRPDDSDRNLFRFQPKAPPPRPVQPVRPVDIPTPPAVRQGPPPPPSTPPISLKFVGWVGTDSGLKIASLNDGRGVVLGKEGDIVLGRYKIWRIGEESIDVSYADGSGRTTIRLTGQ